MRFKYSTRKRRIWVNRHRVEIGITTVSIVGSCLGVFLGWKVMTTIAGYRVIKAEITHVTVPCPKTGETPTIEPTATPKPTSKPSAYRGLASYYSFEGCLGCSENRTMANGEKLDDRKTTIAVNFLPLNTYVKVTNLKNLKSVLAKVTDTGGFGKYNRIADMSVATKEAIACSDLCLVELELYGESK